MTITWPAALVPQRCVPALRNFALSGGRTLTGRQQRTFFDAGFWTVRYDGIVVKDRETANTYQATLARLRQGEDVNLPIPNLYPPDGVTTPGNGLTLRQAHTQRTTQLDMMSVEVTVTTGTYLCIDQWIYQVTDVTLAPAPGGTGRYIVGILPPLRLAYPEAKTVKPRILTLRCVLDDLKAGDLDYDRSGVAFPSLTFIEQAP
ncbi:hypothetical protein [Acuticoccus sediminis]|uniref:hypothetical protein n=1 Tax=Acuticoccus sediminis TaxID=2184697 RepID=UPI001CFD1047|nr:hypothetical protein [Acuticoccus sediminis]